MFVYGGAGLGPAPPPPIIKTSLKFRDIGELYFSLVFMSAGTLSNPQLENVNSHLLKQRPVVIPTNDGQYLERDKTVSLSGKR